jgi:raffinose/stachyose/melibiose transport system substrate-binding protein
LNITPPSTFEQFEAACAKIKNAGIIPVHSAAGDSWPTELWLDCYWPSYIDRNNPGLMDKYSANEIKFADVPDVVEALERQADFAKKGYFGDAPLSDTYSGAADALYNATAAFFPFHEQFYGEQAENYPDMHEKVGFMAFPVDGDNYYGVSSGVSLYISKDSSNTEAAKDFFAYLCRPEVITKMYTEMKAVPWYTGVEIDTLTPQAQDALKAINSGKSGTIWFDFIPAAYGDVSYKALQELILGLKSPKEVLEAIDDEIAQNAKAQGIEAFQ